MQSKFRLSRNVSVAATLLAALGSTTVTVAEPGAAPLGQADLIEVPSRVPAVEQNLPTRPEVRIRQRPEVPSAAESQDRSGARAASLTSLVSAQPQPGDLPRELNCLAGAIYFEAKSESLSGQLAVGRVVVARSKSGRFPNSYCGVVFQPSQFSFVRGGAMPAIPRSSRQWRNAVAVAQIAHAGSWRSPVEGALFFHATHVSPAWRLARVGRVENHVFYR